MKLFSFLIVIISIVQYRIAINWDGAGMTKKVITIFSIIVVVIFSIIVIYRYNQHILVWQANKKINVSGIKLMMTENEVKRIIGEEEVYIPGFGGYKLEYPSKGIFLTFLNDRDTDFYRKVNQIEVIDSKYEVFGIKVGDEFDKAVNILYKQGFIQGKDGFSEVKSKLVCNFLGRRLNP